MPPVPKKADWPNESSPVKPNRISKPRPKMPQTRMRLMVVGVKPRCGSTKGAAMSATAVATSTRTGRFLTIGRLLASGRAEQAIGPQHQHQGHRDEQHHVGVTGVDHRGEADDLARDQAAELRAWK